MTISYKWLCEYLPVSVEPERLSKMLTAIGLEVERMEKYESVKGGLKGLVIGEVLTCERHPGADKLSLTTVNTGSAEPLQIVCGAPNVAAGQKVVVAPVGATIYPASGDPLTMKVAKIRGAESFGMICAEDEVGLGSSHDGIMILPPDAKIGMPAADYFQPYEDTIYEIGLTPNRMDAMSHAGVARDVCAYLAVHDKTEAKVKLPSVNGFKVDHQGLPISITVENNADCPRYAGVCIDGVQVAPSPQWLKDKLLAIGLRPINNIVDITNFILHETGQPLHAFDYDAIKEQKIIVKNLPQDSLFISLDEKERKLFAEDLMICNGESEGMCIGGVFGGIHSGVSNSTVRIFLESAWFNPQSIRRSSLRHGLRTDAATRFEKGVDISNTVYVLKRAAMLIKEIAGGEIASDIIDIYPKPKEKAAVGLKHHYLKKLSGKNYHPDTVKKILEALGFEILKEGIDELRVAVPFSKPDISLPADIVEEIVRIDGLDNIEIPAAITISPAIETGAARAASREKLAGSLVGAGFNEILTNSITNSAYFSEEVLAHTVHMINNLSAELNVMRPSMLETGLESVAYNLNRKNNNLRFFEFGKTYRTSGTGKYEEQEHLCLYITGNTQADSWRSKAPKSDLYFLKGTVAALLQSCGIKGYSTEAATDAALDHAIAVKLNGKTLAVLGAVNGSTLSRFDIKQAVWYADMNWDIVSAAAQQKIEYREIPKFPAVQRDLAMIVARSVTYDKVEAAVHALKIDRLKQVTLFDVFESDKIGIGKKSLAVSFTFLDENKTLTDKEVDSMMNKLMTAMEQEIGAEVRGK